jgi:hypothetical protein
MTTASITVEFDSNALNSYTDAHLAMLGTSSSPTLPMGSSTVSPATWL